jgi:hypothetical protein
VTIYTNATLFDYATAGAVCFDDIVKKYVPRHSPTLYLTYLIFAVPCSSAKRGIKIAQINVLYDFWSCYCSVPYYQRIWVR